MLVNVQLVLCRKKDRNIEFSRRSFLKKRRKILSLILFIFHGGDAEIHYIVHKPLRHSLAVPL